MTIAPAVLLRDLHRLRSHARDLQEEIDRGPRLLKAHAAKIARQEELQQQAQDHLKKLKVSAHEKEVTLRTTHQQIAKHVKQLDEAGGKKEYDALQAEITAEKKKAQQLEDEILETMGTIEEETARLPAHEQAIRQAKEEYATIERDALGRQDELAERLRKTLDELKELETSFPPDMRQHYDRQIASRGEDGMAALAGQRTCSACYTEITAQMVNDLLSGRLVPCKACGRLLYLPE